MNNDENDDNNTNNVNELLERNPKVVTEAGWERCAPHDPNRCQASHPTIGQCPYKARQDSPYCPRHSSTADAIAAKKAANMYRLTKYQGRMAEFATESELKNMRAEIGILRMTLEEIINQCGGNPMELVAYSGKIADLVINIRTLIMSCQKIEVQLGVMLDRDKVMLIGQRIVDILGATLPPECYPYLDEVGDKIAHMILEISVQ